MLTSLSLKTKGVIKLLFITSLSFKALKVVLFSLALIKASCNSISSALVVTKSPLTSIPASCNSLSLSGSSCFLNILFHAALIKPFLVGSSSTKANAALYSSVAF